MLDAFGVAAAHVVGVSAGGAMAQLVALDHPERVSSLTLISTTFALPSDHDLPGPTAEFVSFVQADNPDWSDPVALVDYKVRYAAMLTGGRRPFPEQQVRELVQADVDRARDPASAQNHDLLRDTPRERPPVASIGAPTLVVHGSADPMFPLPHGQALAQEITGARLLVLPDAGHGVERADWPALTAAILEHTAG